MRFGSSVKMVTSEEAKNKRQILFSTNPNPTAREMLTQQKRQAKRGRRRAMQHDHIGKFDLSPHFEYDHHTLSNSI